MDTARGEATAFFGQDVLTGCAGAVLDQAPEPDLVGRADFNQTMSETIQTLESGVLSFGEAAAMIKGVENAVDKRDTEYNEDASLFRQKMESGLLGMKERLPNISVPRSAATPTCSPCG